MKKKIAYNEYLTLLGLAAVRDRHLFALEAVKESVAALLDDTLDRNRYGHASDFSFLEESVDEFLGRLDVKVQPAESSDNEERGS